MAADTLRLSELMIGMFARSLKLGRPPRSLTTQGSQMLPTECLAAPTQYTYLHILNLSYRTEPSPVSLSDKSRVQQSGVRMGRLVHLSSPGSQLV
jgi:hypothetical protein